MKRLFGILGGLAVAASAHAQSSVTVSGTIDAFAGSLRYAGDTARTKVVNSGGMTTSYFGFSGVEDLGGGLTAVFNLNAFFQGDTGTIGRFNGDPFFARDANIGLSGRYGVIALGRGKAPNFLPSVFVNPYGDSFTFSPLILHENISTAGWKYITSPSDTGWGNQVVYTTPNLSGLRASLQYQFGEQSDDSKKNVGANVLYNSGPWTAVAFYERDQVTNPNPSLITATINGVVTPATKKDWMVGGAYDAGIVKGYASYGRSTTDVNSFSAKTSQLGATIPVGVAFILADWAHTSVSGPYTGTRNTESLGYDYFMSKRTDLYAVVMHDQVTNLQSGNTVALGIRSRF
jgi:predicted porin